VSEIFGYVGAILIGVTLGLIGAGGSILTVPVLVYLLGVEPVVATAYSLFVVGLTALAGSLAYMRHDMVSYKTALVFSAPSFVGVFLVRKFVLPAIPDELFHVGGLVVSKNLGVMILFAVLMVMASLSMIRQGEPHSVRTARKFNTLLIFIEGFVVGMITGLVGAGGGFLIIPALVILAGLPMKLAVGTSLLIIAAKSLLGFTGDLGTTPMDWWFLLKFSVFTVLGIVLGAYAGRRISGARLKPAFGWFVMGMGVYVILKELLLGRT
jgi:uncharacterized membrane protein YfcA